MCMSVQAVIVILMDEHFDLLIVSIWKRRKKYIYLHLLITMCEAINKFCGRDGAFYSRQDGGRAGAVSFKSYSKQSLYIYESLKNSTKFRLRPCIQNN